MTSEDIYVKTLNFIKMDFRGATLHINMGHQCFFHTAQYISNNFHDVELKAGTRVHHDPSYQLQLFEINSHLIMLDVD